MQLEKTVGSSPGGIWEEIAFNFKSWELCLFGERMTSLSSYVSEISFTWREIITAKAWSQPPIPQQLERHSVNLSLLRPGVKTHMGRRQVWSPRLLQLRCRLASSAQGPPAGPYPKGKYSTKQGPAGQHLAHPLPDVSPGTVCSFYKQTMAEMKSPLFWEEPGHNFSLFFQRFLHLFGRVFSPADTFCWRDWIFMNSYVWQQSSLR